MRTPYYESTMHRQIREKRENRRDRIRNDLELYGEEVLNSEEMRQAFEQTHHTWSTVGEHTFRVAFTSVLISYALKKLNIKVSVPAVVVGALCHDLGILGRKDKFSSAKEMSIEHPKDSVAVARELVGEMPDKTEDIIERHMWPAGQSKAPNSIEAAIVSAADKYSAVKDIIKGSEVKETGVKYYVRDEKEKIRNLLKG
ncbi:MAG: HD domain-containing protein [Mogibacterium sp.]|nr:HD domain-containing protein [Mogibacterium sp.]MBR2539307.1 HD domain-containing protein [Mogibacterium sp.]